MSHVNSGSDPPPPALKAQDAGEPHSPMGIPTLEALPQTRSSASGFLGLGCCGPGLGPRCPRWGWRVFQPGGRGQGAGARGRRPSGDAETRKPAPGQRGGGNRGARPGSRGSLLTAGSPLAPAPAAGTTRLLLRPLFPAGGAGGFGLSQDRHRVPRELSTAVPQPVRGCAHQKDAPIRSLWAPLANLPLKVGGGRHFLRSRGLVLGSQALRNLQPGARGVGGVGGASLERSNRNPGKPGKKPDHPEGSALSGLKCPGGGPDS